MWGGNAQPVQDGPGQGDTVGHLPAASATITRQRQVVNIRAPQRLRQPEIQSINFKNSFNLHNPSFLIKLIPKFFLFSAPYFFNPCFQSGSTLVLISWIRMAVLWNRNELLRFRFQLKKSFGLGPRFRIQKIFSSFSKPKKLHKILPFQSISLLLYKKVEKFHVLSTVLDVLLKGLSHEIDFKNVDQNLKNLA